MSFDVFKSTFNWARENEIHLFDFDEVASTNDVAKKEAFVHGSDLALYLAAHQTHGRGRFERQWVENESGSSLLSSWSFATNQAPSPVLTARIGLAVVESFSRAFPNSPWSLKAPNDIYLKGQKVAGILTESVSQGPKHRLIIGLGVNVLSSPSQIADATHVERDVVVDEKSWHLFLTSLLERFSDLKEMAHSATLQPHEQRELLHWLNLNPNLKGSYSAVDPDGSLTYDGQKIFWMDL